MTNPLETLSVVLSEYTDASKWEDAPFGRIRRIPNSHVGSVGQDFVERLCQEYGFECEFPVNAKGERSKTSPWDIQIEGVRFELKTATEDVSGCFQFNHVRYHRDYDAMLCVGISPASVHFGIWSKAEIATGKAGHLVSMEKSGSASHKLSKRKEQLHPIKRFSETLTDFLSRFSK